MTAALHRRVNLPVIGPSSRAVAPAFDPPCVACGRRRSVHGKVLELDQGEQLVPSCEQIHSGGMYPEGPAELRPRPMARRLAIARALTPRAARAIAGTLGAPSKMPGAAYGIDAFQCKVGEQLAGVRGSVCFGCYARKNFYAHWWPAMRARAYRQASIGHEYWAEALIAMIEAYVRDGGEPYFRWHDSGDLQSVEHLADICAVAEATPAVVQWLPTREYRIVADYRARGGDIPPNLIVRLSAHWIGKPAKVTAAIADLPTSTVHQIERWTVPIAGAVALECEAYTRGGVCGDCRACWDASVKNVSYLAH